MYSDAHIAFLLVVLVCPFIIAAMVSDVKTRKLPNLLTVTIALLSLGLHTVFYGLGGLTGSILGLLIGFGLLLPFYIFKMVGAGDIKLLAALGAFLGKDLILPGVAAGAILGGVCSAVLILRQKREERAARWALIATKMSSLKMLKSDFAAYDSLGGKQRVIPYGVYLGLGTIGTGVYKAVTLTWGV